MIKNYISVA
ncbi:UDP-Gal or UDP-GlcNAc-dependent glycosyltransferase, putative, partial [Trypanosoma vivax Y486]